MLEENLIIIILMAGQGKRMFSTIPKALHCIAGKAIGQYVIDVAEKLNDRKNIYVLYNEDSRVFYKDLFYKNRNLNWISQNQSIGTGYAVRQVLYDLDLNGNILILYGDMPLISVDTLQSLIKYSSKDGISLLTAIVDNPDIYDYSRIVRKNGQVVKVVEHKDANKDQKLIKEINTGILYAHSKNLKCWLKKVKNKNSQQEYYLTDIISIAYNNGNIINVIHPNDSIEIEGINNKLQLARIEKLFQQKQSEKLMLSGVTLLDPDTLNIRGNFNYGKDIVIDSNVTIEGIVTFGDRVTICTGCIIKNTIIGDDVKINPYSIIEDSKICNRVTVGPFAHLRPGNDIKEDSKIGNFVEIKKTFFGKKSKVNHLSYLGDAKVGNEVNFGAGTVICNYDGINKNETIIGDNVFIGSNSQLISPLRIGNNVTIGAGTTVTENINDGDSVISRVRQFSIVNSKNKNKK